MYEIIHLQERDVRSVPIQLPTPMQNAFPEAKFRGDDDLDVGWFLSLRSIEKRNFFRRLFRKFICPISKKHRYLRNKCIVMVN